MSRTCPQARAPKGLGTFEASASLTGSCTSFLPRLHQAMNQYGPKEVDGEMGVKQHLELPVSANTVNQYGPKEVDGEMGVMRDLRDRGLAPPLLAVGDGALGLWAA